MKSGVFLAVAALVAAVGCYKPSPQACELQCNAASGCPAGLACENNFCVEPNSGTVCGVSDDADPDGPGFDGEPDGPPSPMRLYDALAVGAHHACAIDTDGRLWCWGLNDFRQTGVVSGADNYAAVPQRVQPTMTNGEWTAIAAGAYHTCGLWTPTAAATELWCWGRNDNYQTGQTGSNLAPHMVAAPAGHRWKALALGTAHSCGVVENTTTMAEVIYCWGDNTLGQLGSTGIGMFATPMAIDATMVSPATTRWRSLTAGNNHSCALAMDGKAYCWGDNNRGQGGQAIGGNSDLARPVQGGFLWDSIAAGDEYTCAIDASTRTLRCWGRNGARELGNGGTMNTGTPTSVIDQGSSARWKSLGLGLYSSCGIQGEASSTDAIGTVRCWGDNDFGQRGDGTFVTPTTGPTFGVLDNAFAIDSGHEFACALTGAPAAGGSLYCWGRNSDGELGTGIASNQRRPVRVGEGVRGTQTWLTVAAGRQHTCAILSGATQAEQQLYCWGAAMSGQIDGVVVPVPRRAPVRVANGDGATHVAVGSSHTCVRKMGVGLVQCWGSDQAYQLGVSNNQEPGPVTTYDNASAVTPTRVFGAGNVTCVYGSATTQCWGSPELTTPYFIDNDLPQTVSFTGGVIPNTSLTVGPSSGCWIEGTETRCFGTNSFGQLGYGMMATPATQPVAVFGLSDATKLSVGPSNHRCALTTGRVARCWGANGYSQCGDIDTSSDKIAPVTVMGANQFDSIATGLNHTCGLDGTVIRCWGNNDQFQRTAIASGSFLPPAPIVAPQGEAMPAWTQVATGEYHTCAISQQGILYCWGASRWGQVGAGAASEASAMKVLDGTP